MLLSPSSSKEIIFIISIHAIPISKNGLGKLVVFVRTGSDVVYATFHKIVKIAVGRVSSHEQFHVFVVYREFPQIREMVFFLVI